MLNHLPKHLPPLSVMLADLGNPRPEQIAKALGVSSKTVYRWMRCEQAPRAAMLALFWLTRWGVSQIHCQAHNDALHQAQLAACFRAQLGDALAKLDRLGRIGDFGAANDPAHEVRRRAPALPVIPVPGEPQPAAKKPRKKTASQRRAELVEQRLAKLASSDPRPFDFLRVG